MKADNLMTKVKINQMKSLDKLVNIKSKYILKMILNKLKKIYFLIL